ncbi:MAG: histidine phosphatase family protein [Thermoanaerobaculia bacterium]
MFERLILSRHGQTLDNARGVAQGWSDSDLSDEGRAQARLLGVRLRDFGPTSIYSSTLARARKTAEIIGAELGLEVHAIDDLREVNCGEWEGVAFDEVRRMQPEPFRAWLHDPSSPAPGGESFADVDTRVRRAMLAIGEHEAEKGGKPVPLIVSHGLAIRILATGLLGLPLTSARTLLQDNASINILEWRSDRYLLRCWNDIGHHAYGR